ncbi:MAG: prenyltransferase [Proteobacteria bacterium]|nr:prenyltransferase [Pseudomonadota bacterium]
MSSTASTHLLAPAALRHLLQPGTTLLTLAACGLGASFALTCGCGFDARLAVATLALALLAQAGANLLAEHHLARRNAPAAPLASPAAGQHAWLLLGLVIPAGLLLAAHGGGALLPIGAAGLLLLWAGAAPPLALNARGLGALAAAPVWWLLVLGADCAQRQRLLLVPAVTAVSFALLAANVGLLRPRTARAGPRPLAALTLAVALLAHGWQAAAVWAVIAPGGALWGLAALPLSLAAALAVRLGWQAAGALAVAAATVHALAMATGLLMST